VLLVITTVNKAPAFTIAEGWTSGTSTMQPRCERMSHATEELTKAVFMHWYHLSASPAHWSHELNAG